MRSCRVNGEDGDVAPVRGGEWMEAGNEREVVDGRRENDLRSQETTLTVGGLSMFAS